MFPVRSVTYVSGSSPNPTRSFYEFTAPLFLASGRATRPEDAPGFGGELVEEGHSSAKCRKTDTPRRKERQGWCAACNLALFGGGGGGERTLKRKNDYKIRCMDVKARV